jgi:hypothetical protein
MLEGVPEAESEMYCSEAPLVYNRPLDIEYLAYARWYVYASIFATLWICRERTPERATSTFILTEAGCGSDFLRRSALG